MFKPMIFSAALGAVLAAGMAEARPTLRDAALSARLYEIGVEEGDPLLIIAAAKLRKGIDPEEVTRRPEGGGEAGDGPGHLSWDEMLTRAEDLAYGNATVLGLIEDVRAEGTKGVVIGPVYSISQIGSGKTDTYPELPFRAAEYAEIYLEGKGRADLNLYVYDGQGRLVCSDTDISDIAYCGWRPRDADKFTIKVENRGPTTSTYSLMTN